MNPNAATRRLAAILSADVAGYSRLMAEDEDHTVRTLTEHREAVTKLVPRFGGRVVDFSGDNFLAEFPSAVNAIKCAFELQESISARNAGVEPQRRMEFRIGAHVGDVRVDGERIYGDGVNIAARLENLAGAGEICLSGAVYDQVRRMVDLPYQDLGEQVFKHLPDPVRAYRLRPRGASGELRSEAPHTTAGGAAAPGRIQSLAVLPLENLSDDAEQEYFADGMTEALINDLAKISALRVVSRTSVMQYKRVRRPLPEIAKALNVDGIIEGSVIREGDRVRITVQLIDARRDQHLWAERYDRYLRGILALQNEIARTVAAQIQIELTPEEEELLEGPLDRWFARIRRDGVPQD